MLGQARASGLIAPERENTLLRGLITEWALASTLETARACAGIGRVPMHMGQPAVWQLADANSTSGNDRTQLRLNRRRRWL